MDDFSKYFKDGAFYVMLAVYVVKSFLDKTKDKERRLNQNDITDALQDQKMAHIIELSELKIKHAEEVQAEKNKHYEFRLSELEKRTA